jgi:AcrR family transcriptional regulator
LAKYSGIGISSIYHFFSNKDDLLLEIFGNTNKHLGIERAKLPQCSSASEMLYQRVHFQFDNIEDVVFVLKYYLHFRSKFLKLEQGYLPAKGYLHIEEVLRYGIENNEFTIHPEDIYKESKVIAHAINGFLLEYYPETPTPDELHEVIGSIHVFLMRSLTSQGVIMK